ncbi:ACT domain-containing protein [Curtobacterium sp. ISL-83]|uniref:ACT domain-containing protein n=1 Tax=Curtobacterium sp. ISL-83 TaxID=2819145 RepID=UPI002034F435|nr:ACT domain-containing protein [Curtobacterium sp. ISL-83]
MVPLEFGTNVMAFNTVLPFLLKLVLMTAVTSGLAIWIAEPTMMRLLGRWLHGTALRVHSELHAAPALWRIRTAVDDQPGALGHLSGALARSGVNILSIQVYPGGEDHAVDELVVSAPEDVSCNTLAGIVHAAGGRDTRIWPTTAVAVVDPVSHALGLAVRVTLDPDELPMAAAELLHARLDPPDGDRPSSDGAAIITIPAAFAGVHVLTRPGEPFTAAERARAAHLAELAEMGALRPGAP